MRFIIVTGMSGAGKSSVLKMLEDMGFFCVDNLPVRLLKRLIQMMQEKDNEIENMALGIDIRNGKALEQLKEEPPELGQMGIKCEILFLDCSTPVLVKRYKETRRNHPLSDGGRVDKGIELERERLLFLRESADYIIDTSQLWVRELRAEINRTLFSEKKQSSFYVTVVSFGFKYGIPSDSDLVFDVRFLPNPFYIPELKDLTGNDRPVYEYVMDNENSVEFVDKLEDMIKFLIPNYIKEGKNQLVIGIGCTGGKHRSVTISNVLIERLKDSEYGWKIEHRDIEKDKTCHFQAR